MSQRVSPLENEQCKQCRSFADYVKVNQKKFQAETSEASDGEPRRRPDCPLDKDKLGKYSWSLLHTIAAKYPKCPTDQNKRDMVSFLNLFAKFYPCDFCAKDFRDDMKDSPPKVGCQNDLSQWLCEMHNNVNQKIGKPLFDCSKVNERWRDGWTDGSCDF